MTIATTIEHVQWKDAIYNTEFCGEREALERSDVLRPLLPPAGRQYIKHPDVAVDGRSIISIARSCHLKHGGMRVTLFWNRGTWGGDVPSRAEIIALTRQIQAECLGRPLALAGWPFPIGVAA